MSKIDLTGQRFGYLIVLGDSGKRDKCGRVIWHCRCDCGNECYKPKNRLELRTPNCGCKGVKKDMYVGYRIGKLTVTKYLGLNESKRRIWECACDCGNIVVHTTQELHGGRTKSCGCSKKNQGDKLRIYYGVDKKLHDRWWDIKSRCNNPNNSRYKDYGGRGIKMCPEWENDFWTFRDWSLANGFREGLTIDRIDNDKGYSPDNCRWVTNAVQANNKRSCRYITINGVTKNLKEWSVEYNINYHTVQNRIFNGWDEVRAITIPSKKKK